MKYGTSGGVMLSDALIRRLAAEAEAGYNLSRLKPRNGMKPRICRIVEYRSRTGSYTCPALIVATRDSLNIENVEKGWIPNLSDETNVHLVIFSAGNPNLGRSVAEAELDFLVKSPHGHSVNLGGTYQEWDIPYDPNGSPGTWKWPDRE